jgi:ubiquinone/menaquinone biosynthesis C-methylase UbiE
MEGIMPKARIVETDSGIEGEFTVATYDMMQRRLRDRGWIETNDIIQSGITEGLALELGPGPGYLGLEWLKNTDGTRLKGLDISADMIAIAERNAQEYSLRSRVEYLRSSGDKMPFDNTMFDAVFTNGSLHEWADPKNTLNEIWRVLKKGGMIFISDLRRDMVILLKWFLYIATKPKEIRPGLISSINAAYTPDELKELIKDTKLANCEVAGNLIGVKITGKK